MTGFWVLPIKESMDPSSSGFTVRAPARARPPDFTSTRRSLIVSKYLLKLWGATVFFRQSSRMFSSSFLFSSSRERTCAQTHLCSHLSRHLVKMGEWPERISPSPDSWTGAGWGSAWWASRCSARACPRVLTPKSRRRWTGRRACHSLPLRRARLERASIRVRGWRGTCCSVVGGQESVDWPAGGGGARLLYRGRTGGCELGGQKNPNPLWGRWEDLSEGWTFQFGSWTLQQVSPAGASSIPAAPPFHGTSCRWQRGLIEGVSCSHNSDWCIFAPWKTALTCSGWTQIIFLLCCTEIDAPGLCLTKVMVLKILYFILER